MAKDFAIRPILHRHESSGNNNKNQTQSHKLLTQQHTKFIYAFHASMHNSHTAPTSINTTATKLCTSTWHRHTYTINNRARAQNVSAINIRQYRCSAGFAEGFGCWLGCWRCSGSTSRNRVAVKFVCVCVRCACVTNSLQHNMWTGTCVDLREGHGAAVR